MLGDGMKFRKLEMGVLWGQFIPCGGIILHDNHPAKGRQGETVLWISTGIGDCNTQGRCNQKCKLVLDITVIFSGGRRTQLVFVLMPGSSPWFHSVCESTVEKEVVGGSAKFVPFSPPPLLPLCLHSFLYSLSCLLQALIYHLVYMMYLEYNKEGAWRCHHGACIVMQNVKKIQII